MEHDEMNNLKTILEMIIIIIKDSKDKNEAIDKIKSLSIFKN